MASGPLADATFDELLSQERSYRAQQSFLEVHDQSSEKLSLEPLSGARQLIGRDPNLKLFLDDASVSRLHAALVRDPYARWWIHDLGSTNGTYVNGTRVTQRLVNPNDTIEIGRFRLIIRLDARASERPTAPPLPPSSKNGAPATTRFSSPTLDELNAVVALEAIESARSLLLYEDRQRRLNALCELSVGDRFPGVWAAVVRLNRTGPAEVIGGPVSRHVDAVKHDGEKLRLRSLCEEHRHQLLGSSRPQVLPLDDSSDFLIGSPISTFPDGAELLFVKLREKNDPEEWSTLLSLLAASFRYASELWDTRGQFGLNAAIERELEMARQLQKSLIPRLPVMPGVDLCIGYEPSRWVGGDYADAVQMPDGRVLLTVADVCGKGLQAALVAASLHTLVHVLVETSSIVTMARQMNSYLCSYLPEHSFVTMVFVAVDAGRRELECVNLGHPPPLLVTAGGSVRGLQSGQNVALGMADLIPDAERYELGPEEMLFLYTDGLMDPDYQEQDETRLPGQLAACVPLIASMTSAPVEGICDKLLRCIGAGRSPMTDDAAFLLARLQGGRAPQVARTLYPAAP